MGNELLSAFQNVKDTYKPDILTCLANLSNDEVFTPPSLANQILGMLPQELFESKDTKFLDPACKSGIFLREIARRLMKGLEKIIPDEQERRNHIFTKQIFGIAITELTAQMSRRSVYCSKQANGKYSVCNEFANEDGNIKFTPILHTFKNGNCVYCGASEKEYGEKVRNKLESHAYEFIHLTEKQIKEMQDMKFDVIIGNPPYQLSDGSGASTDAAMPIYQKFVEQAKKLRPRFLTMIIPSRWMVGGRGLNSFREDCLNDLHFKEIHDFVDASQCFPGVHIDGGVCYFLWDKDYNGKVDYYYMDEKGEITYSKHFLKNDYSDKVIRNNNYLGIIEKTNSINKFSNIVSSTQPFGIRKDLFNSPSKYKDYDFSLHLTGNSYKIYGVKGIKGGAKRQVGYVTKNIIYKNNDAIDKYKLFFTTSYSSDAINFPDIIIAGPDEICTETFLMIGPFDSAMERDNCYSYMQTNFFKILLFIGKGTMQVNKSVFNFIPIQDFSKSWTDKELFKKYNLTEEEIKFINSMVRPEIGE